MDRIRQNRMQGRELSPRSKEFEAKGYLEPVFACYAPSSSRLKKFQQHSKAIADGEADPNSFANGGNILSWSPEKSAKTNSKAKGSAETSYSMNNSSKTNNRERQPVPPAFSQKSTSKDSVTSNGSNAGHRKLTATPTVELTRSPTKDTITQSPSKEGTHQKLKANAVPFIYNSPLLQKIQVEKSVSPRTRSTKLTANSLGAAKKPRDVKEKPLATVAAMLARARDITKESATDSARSESRQQIKRGLNDAGVRSSSRMGSRSSRTGDTKTKLEEAGGSKTTLAGSKTTLGERHSEAEDYSTNYSTNNSSPPSSRKQSQGTVENDDTGPTFLKKGDAYFHSHVPPSWKMVEEDNALETDTEKQPTPRDPIPPESPRNMMSPRDVTHRPKIKNLLENVLFSMKKDSKSGGFDPRQDPSEKGKNHREIKGLHQNQPSKRFVPGSDEFFQSYYIDAWREYEEAWTKFENDNSMTELPLPPGSNLGNMIERGVKFVQKSSSLTSEDDYARKLYHTLQLRYHPDKFLGKYGSRWEILEDPKCKTFFAGESKSKTVEFPLESMDTSANEEVHTKSKTRAEDATPADRQRKEVMDQVKVISMKLIREWDIGKYKKRSMVAYVANEHI